MRKMIRTLVFGAVIAAPLILAPHQSKAGIITDILTGIFGKDKKTTTPTDPNCPPGTSVPLNEGQVFLIVAGLGLGAKLLYDRHRKHVTKSII